MKKIVIILFAGCLLLAGCHKKTKTENVDVSTNSEQTEVPPVMLTFDTIGFNDQPDTVPSLSIGVSIVLPVVDKDNPVAGLLRRQILIDALGEKYSKQSTEADLLKAFVEDQRSDFSGVMSDFEEDRELIEAEGMSYMYKWERTMHGSVVMYNPPLLVYEADFFSYEGGAHGMFCNNYALYSTVTGKRLKLDDVFVSDKPSREQMASILLKRLMEQIEHEKDYEGMEIQDIGAVQPVEDFSVDSAGFTFYFQPYVVAAYCYGVVAIKVPVAYLSPYMRPETEVARFFDAIASPAVVEK